MSKNNYKCLINSSAPRCVIIITINTGINHSYTISSMARSKHITSHQHSNTLLPATRRKLFSHLLFSSKCRKYGSEAPTVSALDFVVLPDINE